MRVCYLFVLIFVIANICLGQQRQENESPLSYEIGLGKVCESSRSITVRLNLRNTSSRDLIIDKNAMLYQVEYEKKSKMNRDGSVGQSVKKLITSDPGPDYSGDYMILKSKGAYERTRTFHLDEPFFEPNRMFGLSLTYGFFIDNRYFLGKQVWTGVVASNSVEFSLSKETLCPKHAD